MTKKAMMGQEDQWKTPKERAIENVHFRREMGSENSKKESISCMPSKG